MGAEHDHSHNANKRTLLISFLLIAIFMVVEVIGGIVTNSLALLSDAGHMLSDAVALGLSLLAFALGEKSSDASKTFGYKRFEILAAFLNGITLLGISIYIFWESYNRFITPPEVASTGMLIIALIGFGINILVAFIMYKGGDTSENINLRSAFLHVLGDLLGSVGAIVAALLIMFLGWSYADPIASIIVAILVLVSGWRVTKESVHVLMEGKPSSVEVEKIEKALLNIDGVKDVHDLHVWTITSDFPSLTCHLVIIEEERQNDILEKATELLQKDFNLKHTTIQVEVEGTILHQECEYCH
ncbi:cation diffusion facilitator family transporter [Pseudalkalibacillus caeni]|uniref:Cation transporter n=1 Tax=Exobacillus caeni TaxID=2574798 RepID=A0A5R9F789_9BACL|nr:cation diffusion facilitator family transporter [Pseudalkalibacillus caeni]TLS38901.1 cation transporter [Pseudalkalibacillus caeni]